MLVLADFLESIADRDLIPIVAIVGGLTIAALGIVFGTVRRITVARAKEATKRELAAYVAEGSLDADKAVAIINADTDEASKTT